MLAALLSLLPALAGLTLAAPVPHGEYADPAYPTDPAPTYPDHPEAWVPYPAPSPTPEYPEYAYPDAEHTWPAWSPAYKTGCDVSAMQLPAYAYAHYEPDTPEWTAWHEMMPEGHLMGATTARGVQNYTCSGGYYVSTGATADHYDTSCAVSYATTYQSYAANLPYYVYDAVSYPWTDENTYRSMWLEYAPYADGYAPKWTRGDGYYMYGRKVASYTPDEKHLPWVRYEGMPMEAGWEAYALAHTVLRTDTVGGMPAPYCSEEGGMVSVPYAANYYFYA